MTAPLPPCRIPPMRIKTLTAPTMPEALRLIRDQLGPEALILSTRKVVGPQGTPTLEITAAMEEPELSTRPVEPLPTLPDPQKPVAHPGEPALLASLRAHGVSPDLLERIASALPGLCAAGFKEIEALEMLLGRVAPFRPWHEVLAPGKAHVFVGPHGAGKTTLVAKLAIQAHQNGQQAGVISLDTQKVAGFEPLAATADALGDTAHLVTDAPTLRAAAASLGPRTMLLVDTPGLNPYAPAGMAALHKTLAGLGLPLVAHLVVPANLNPDDMALLPVAAHRFGLTSLIPTRMDATSRFGAVLSTAAAASLPLGLATNSTTLGTAPFALGPLWMAQALARLPTQPWEIPA